MRRAGDLFSKGGAPSYQIRRELISADFEEIEAATAASPPRQVEELAEDICSAY
jgi:hypothetical protein